MYIDIFKFWFFLSYFIMSIYNQVADTTLASERKRDNKVMMRAHNPAIYKYVPIVPAPPQKKLYYTHYNDAPTYRLAILFICYILLVTLYLSTWPIINQKIYVPTGIGYDKLSVG